MKKNGNKQSYDIIVIGAGAGGLNIAGFCNRIGLQVLLIDVADTRIGGDCLNYGCVPSKALIHVARIAREAREAREFGLQVTGDIDMSRVKSYISSGREHIRTHENAAYFQEKGMDVVLGKAVFSGEQSVMVDETEYFGKKIIIATGSKPRELRIPGSEMVRVHTNETIFDCDVLPKRLVVIGGGPIGVEIGQAFALLGSAVTIVCASDHVLPREDTDIARVLTQQLEKDGINILYSSSANAFIDSHTLQVKRADDSLVNIAFDAVFSAIGRDVDVSELHPEKANIRVDETGKRLQLNDTLQTSNRAVFACGDVAGRAQFTHETERQASIILNNMFSPFQKKMDDSTLAWSTFTYPEVATFGRSEAELTRLGMSYEVVTDDFSRDDRAIIDKYPASLVKLYISKGKLLGGTMVAPIASELIQELILAQNANISVETLFKKTYPYPTATRINKKVISSYLSKKITDRSSRILRFLFRLM